VSRLLSFDEAAAASGVHRKTLYRWRKPSGKRTAVLPVTKHKNETGIDERDLTAFLDQIGRPMLMPEPDFSE
jgi:hypothetical protein